MFKLNDYCMQRKTTYTFNPTAQIILILKKEAVITVETTKTQKIIKSEKSYN